MADGEQRADPPKTCRAGDKPNTEWRAQTNLVRGGLRRSAFSETAEALFVTSGYVYGTAEEAETAFAAGGEGRFVYSRYSNPTVSMFEERLRLLEGAEAARATASGMAAVFASLMCQLKAGDRVVSSRALFGSCHYIIADLLPRYDIETVLIDGTKLEEWRAALARPAAAVFLETPSNPMLELVDLREVARLAHEAGAKVVVDNVFATPLHQKPLALGADIVVYSATKHIDGQGRCLGGAVLGPAKYVEEKLAPFLKHTGPAMSPFNAWVLVKGLETLKLRVDAQCRAAREVAEFLSSHPAVERTLYPLLDSHPQVELARRQMTAGGTLVSFVVRGGKAAAFRLLNRLKIVDISNNLGDSKSLICHPATTTHQRLPADERARLGIGEGALRLSVGLEDTADLIADLRQALEA
ncbi:MAG TPA: O-succinylhomoserine sulfhydrylase [Alphaproteobacteria bacterium]|jgi:O-succinylhomoserine sulfhydrylase|nr:O-succinylhomoserine sulfhydrylase [Alphaproteobacteria bacterium]